MKEYIISICELCDEMIIGIGHRKVNMCNIFCYDCQLKIKYLIEELK